MTEIDRLKEILKVDEFWEKGQEWDGFTVLAYDYYCSTRWEEINRVVVHSVVTGKCYRYETASGLTEYRENRGVDFDSIVEVEAYAETVIKYRRVIE